MRNYNNKMANILAQEFKTLTGIDFTSKSRKVSDVCIRTLFYKILTDKLNMKDIDISKWFMNEHNIKRERSSIYHALQKVDLYYQSYKSFRDLYDTYFDDKAEQRKEQEDKEQRVKNSTPNALYKSSKLLPIEKKRNALKCIIDTLPANRLEEIEELLTLRIKSWQWKSKDRITIIEGNESLSDFIF